MSHSFVDLLVLLSLLGNTFHSSAQRPSVASNAMQILEGNMGGIIFNYSLSAGPEDNQEQMTRFRKLSRFEFQTPLSLYPSPLKLKKSEFDDDDDDEEKHECLRVSIVILNKTPYVFELEDRWNSGRSVFDPESDDVAPAIISGQIIKSNVKLCFHACETNATFSEGISYSILDKFDG